MEAAREAATDSLVGMFEQFQEAQIQQQETYKELHFELLEERFLRHVSESAGRLRTEIGESERRLRAEMQAGFDRQQEQLARQQEQLIAQQEQTAGLGKEIGAVRSDLGKQIGAVHADVNRQIGDVHQQIARQTRWNLTVLGGVAVLSPIIQRVMAVLLP